MLPQVTTHAAMAEEEGMIAMVEEVEGIMIENGGERMMITEVAGIAMIEAEATETTDELVDPITGEGIMIDMTIVIDDEMNMGMIDASRDHSSRRFPWANWSRKWLKSAASTSMRLLKM
jgi:hypothetical protein